MNKAKNDFLESCARQVKARNQAAVEIVAAEIIANKIGDAAMSIVGALETLSSRLLQPIEPATQESKKGVKYGALFLCGFVDVCPTCKCENPDSACSGKLVDFGYLTSDVPTNGEIVNAVGGCPACPDCGSDMVLNDFWEAE